MDRDFFGGTFVPGVFAAQKLIAKTTGYEARSLLSNFWFQPRPTWVIVLTPCFEPYIDLETLQQHSGGKRKARPTASLRHALIDRHFVGLLWRHQLI